jgi:iron transport multicopper oxidase
MIEAPTELQGLLQIPESHYDACRVQSIPTAGNAAANTVDLYDMTGENTSPPPLPAGFTARGIVALVFSCASAFMGMAVIIWYGMMPITGQVKGGVKENGHVSNGSANGEAGGGNGVVEVVVESSKTG